MISLLLRPSDSLLMLLVSGRRLPSLNHSPSESGLATSHSNTASWDSATVWSVSGLEMAPPLEQNKYKCESFKNIYTIKKSLALSSLKYQILKPEFVHHEMSNAIILTYIRKVSQKPYSKNAGPITRENAGVRKVLWRKSNCQVNVEFWEPYCAAYPAFAPSSEALYLVFLSTFFLGIYLIFVWEKLLHKMAKSSMFL